MPVYFVAYKNRTESASKTDRERAEVRKAAFHAVVKKRFPDEAQRRLLAKNVYAVDTEENMSSVAALVQEPDAIYVAPMSGPIIGMSAKGDDAFDWLKARLLR